MLTVGEQQVIHSNAVFNPFGYRRRGPVLHVIRVSDHGEHGVTASQVQWGHERSIFVLKLIASRV